MYYSSLLDKDFPTEEAKEKAEAYHNRIKQGSDAEKRMQKGAEDYAKKGEGRWGNLKKWFGDK